MSRPAVIENETILAAARDVFLERGLRGTTADVASRAGVSEGTLFKRFKSKEALFRAAMRTPVDLSVFADIGDRVGKGEVREHLVDVGLRALEAFRTIVPFIMTVMASPDYPGLPHPGEGDHPATRSMRAMMGYLEAEMRLGRIRRSDAEILARTFLGSIFNYAWLDTTTHANEDLPLPAEAFVRGIVALLWAGIAPQPPPPTGIGAKGRKKSAARRG